MKHSHIITVQMPFEIEGCTHVQISYYPPESGIYATRLAFGYETDGGNFGNRRSRSLYLYYTSSYEEFKQFNTDNTNIVYSRAHEHIHDGVGFHLLRLALFIETAADEMLERLKARQETVEIADELEG